MKTFDQFYSEAEFDGDTLDELDPELAAPLTPLKCLEAANDLSSPFLFLTSLGPTTDDFQVLVVHDIAKYRVIASQRMNDPYHEQYVATEGNNNGTSATLVLIPSRYFKAATVRVKNFDAMEQALSTNDGKTMYGPFKAEDIDTEEIKVRPMTVFPPEIIGLVLQAGAIHPVALFQEFLNFFPTAAERAPYSGCIKALQSMVTLVVNTADEADPKPPGIRIDYPSSPTVSRAGVVKKRAIRLKSMLPAADATPTTAGAGAVVAAISALGQVVANQTPTTTSTIGDPIGVVATKRLEKQMMTPRNTFPDVWDEMGQTKAAQRLLTLQAAVRETCDEDKLTYPMILPAVLTSLYSGDFAGNVNDNFSGLSVFLFANRSSQNRVDTQRTLTVLSQLQTNGNMTRHDVEDTLDTLVTGQKLTAMSDLEIMWEGWTGFWSTILVPGHVFFTALEEYTALIHTHKQRLHEMAEQSPQLPMMMMNQAFLENQHYWATLARSAGNAIVPRPNFTIFTLNLLMGHSAIPTMTPAVARVAARYNAGNPPAYTPRAPPAPRTPTPAAPAAATEDRTMIPNPSPDPAFEAYRNLNFGTLTTVLNRASQQGDPLPQDDGGTGMCLKWHCTNNCLLTACKRGGNHHVLSAAEKGRFLLWLRTHFT